MARPAQKLAMALPCPSGGRGEASGAGPGTLNDKLSKIDLKIESHVDGNIKNKPNLNFRRPLVGSFFEKCSTNFVGYPKTKLWKSNGLAMFCH